MRHVVCWCSGRGDAATAHWDRAVVARRDAAILAVSVFSLAEIRAGRIYAGWGQPRADGLIDLGPFSLNLARLVVCLTGVGLLIW